MVLVLAAPSAGASNLKASEIKIGTRTVFRSSNYFGARMVGGITRIVSDSKVEIYLDDLCIKRIKDIGIEIKNGCLQNFCVGESVKYYDYESLSMAKAEITHVYDDGTLELTESVFRKSTMISKAP